MYEYIYIYMWDVRNKNPRPKQDESNSFAALAERGLDGTSVWLGQGVIHHFTTYSMLPPSWEIHWRQVNCQPQRGKQFLAQWRHMIRGFFHGFSGGVSKSPCFSSISPQKEDLRDHTRWRNPGFRRPWRPSWRLRWRPRADGATCDLDDARKKRGRTITHPAGSGIKCNQM